MITWYVWFPASGKLLFDLVEMMLKWEGTAKWEIEQMKKREVTTVQFLCVDCRVSGVEICFHSILCVTRG